MKSILTAVLATGVLAFQANAQDLKTVVPVQKVEEKKETKLDKDKVSYAIGMNVGASIKQQSIEVDPDTLAKAIKDVLAGGTTRLTEQEARQTIMEMQTTLRAKREAEAKVAGEKNKKEGEIFLAENAKKTGVKTTASGLQYKVLTNGTGEIPKSTDTVTTHYRGRLINGTEFDSSYKRNQPFDVTMSGGVIQGWIEALQLMKTGSKWEIYVPANLAYGESGRGGIPPNATLIFEIESIAIKPPVESNQAVSGEIIKVPSKAELDKGAKIEVIRPNQTNQAQPKK